MAETDSVLDMLKELAVYYNKQLAESTAQLYVDALQDLPETILKKSALHHTQESPYFPRISELRALAAKISAEADFAETSNTFYWQAMEAFNAALRGEISDEELYRRYGRVLSQCFGTEAWRKEHLKSVGLARVDECPVCHGSGCDQDDPERLADCPHCYGEGGFRIPLEYESPEQGWQLMNAVREVKKPGGGPADLETPAA